MGRIHSFMIYLNDVPLQLLSYIKTLALQLNILLEETTVSDN
jgi:hypothetical protein